MSKRDRMKTLELSLVDLHYHFEIYHDQSAGNFLLFHVDKDENSTAFGEFPTIVEATLYSLDKMGRNKVQGTIVG